MAITIEQYRLQLADPNFALGVIINNNPDAVVDKLRNMGMVVSGPQDIIDALNELLENGNKQGFRDALSVPVILARISPDELAVLQQQVPAMLRASGYPVNKTVDINALFAGLATGTLAYLNNTGGRVDAPGATVQPPAAPPKDNTMAYIIGGIALLAVVVLVVLTMKKK